MLTRLIAVGLVAGLAVGCSDHGHGPHDHDHDHDHDLINRVTLFVTPVSGGAEQAFVWEDADGPGGNAPNRIDTIRLAAGTSYNGRLEFFNTKENKDLTSAIRSERDEHQVFFTVEGNVMAVAASDIDSRNLPVGLEVLVSSVRSGSGTLKIELDHFDNTSDKNGITRSDETDVAVTWPVLVP